MSMMSDKAWQICQDCGGLESEHAEFTREVWIDAVMNRVTHFGYWHWVEVQVTKSPSQP